ncbi:MAG: DUF4251 domain-containing protein [Bacteroidales bacterium]
MKRILIIVFAILLVIPAFVQGQELTNKQQKELQKQLKKEQQAEEASKRALMVGLMVEHRQFVLEADRLKDSQGNTINVSSMINFIACDSVAGVIQVGSNSYVGSNGVGGITVEGPISNFKSTFNEKNSTYAISYIVRSTVGTYDVRISVYSEGRADAMVSSNWPGRITYSGYLVPPSVSKVYKGTSF